MDEEARIRLTEGEQVKLLTESQGWQVVFEKLKDKILDLQNINNIDVTSAESAVADLRARKMAADLLWAWVRADVYGRVEQYEAELKSNEVPVEPDTEYIVRGE